MQTLTNVFLLGFTALFLSGAKPVAADSLGVGPILAQSWVSATERTAESRRVALLDVRDFGATGNSLTDDTAAIQAAIDQAESFSTSGQRRGAVVKFPPGRYRLTAPLVVRQSRIKLTGAGRFMSQFTRDDDYGDTLVIAAQPVTILEEIEIRGFSFRHNNRKAGMTGAHIRATGVTHLTIADFDMHDPAYGIVLNGCVDYLIHRGSIVGHNDGKDPRQTGRAGILLRQIDAPPASMVPIPTQGIIRDTQVFGPRIAGFDFGLVVNAAEQLSVEGGSYFGNARLANILIEQTAEDQPILEITVSPGVYIDGAGQDSVHITGKNGSGRRYIGQIKFNGVNIKGQSGDSKNGIFVDGTPRSGPFRQVLRGLHISGSSISGMKSNGIEINGGTHIIITGNDIKGNNYFNNERARGIVIGSAVTRAIVANNLIGSTPEGSRTSYQEYGIEIIRGATNLTIDSNDVRNNYVGGILDGSADASDSHKRITNNPGFNGNRLAVSPPLPRSSEVLTNPFGSPAFVSIVGGAVGDVQLNGKTVFSTSNVQLMIAAGDRIRLTYSSPPQWIWWLH